MYPVAHLRASLRLVLAIACFSSSAALHAKSSAWPDPQKPGKTFKGEPIETVGPFALFSTGTTSSRRLLLRQLSQEDMIRFYRETSQRPPRAATWTEATGRATREVIGRALQVKNKELAPADFSSLVEPEWLLIVKGSQNDGISWTTVGSVQAFYHRLKRVRPGLLEGIFLGVRHDKLGHRNIAVTSGMPWLVANFSEQSSLSLLSAFAPQEGVHLTLLSRNGAPVLGAQINETVDVRQFVNAITEFIGLCHPDNPLAWPDRLAYARAIRPLQAEKSDLPVEALGNPLRVDAMLKYGIKRVAVKVQVNEQGAVTALDFDAASDFPAQLRPSIEHVLKTAWPLLPSFKAGKPVAGTLTYDFSVPNLNKEQLAELAWVSGVPRTEIPLPQWLVLKPIPVEEDVFSGPAGHVDERGVVQLSAFNVEGGSGVSKKTQLNAFNSNFFDKEGAASVAPKEGDKQVVDDRELTWRTIKSVGGLVDFRTGIENCDYSVGYAWTEFESPSEQEAWLGLGSDDGVKVWLNGEEVEDKWTRRPSRVDDDVIPLKLRKGKNQLLIKIQNMTIDWSFDARLMVR